MKRVLIIDDQACFRGIVRDILENWSEPLYIEEEENGIDAVINVECRDYDLLICDIKMPEMDGFEVVSKVREWRWNPHVPILMLTAERDPASIARGAAIGATGYLTKPFNEVEFLDAVRTMLCQTDQQQAS
ncbi:response regulator [bacterium]|nr:response regulator [bacterium]